MKKLLLVFVLFLICVMGSFALDPERDWEFTVEKNIQFLTEDKEVFNEFFNYIADHAKRPLKATKVINLPEIQTEYIVELDFPQPIDLFNHGITLRVIAGDKYIEMELFGWYPSYFSKLSEEAIREGLKKLL